MQALTDDNGLVSLLFASTCSLGYAHLYEILPGPLGEALGFSGLSVVPLSLG